MATGVGINDRKCLPKPRKKHGMSVKILQENPSKSFTRRNVLPPSPNHLYEPKLHRQKTEKEVLSPVGVALRNFVQTRLFPELDSLARATALLELDGILSHIFNTLSMNTIGLDFQDPMYVSHGFTHWQSEPDKRIICYLPLKLHKIKVHPQNFGTAFLHLPRTFDYKNLDSLDLQSVDCEERRYLSIKQIYVVILKLLGKLLKTKGVSDDNLHFSSAQKLLDISCKESSGWVGEIVPCILVGKTGEYFCCKPHHECVAQKQIVRNQGLSAQPLSTANDYVSNRGSLKKREHDFSQQSRASQLSYSSVTGKLPSLSNCSNTEHHTRVHGPCIDSAKGESKLNDVSSLDVLSSNRSSPLKTPRTNLSGSEYTAKSNYAFRNLSDITEEIEGFDNLDMKWYKCSPLGERQLLNTISMADNGVRVMAVLVICRLFDNDWRLKFISAYHIQTAMLHDADQYVDMTPRWQRNSLEFCTKSILQKLYQYLKIQRLPNFFVHGVNLWEEISQEKLCFAFRALERLNANDNALASLIHRVKSFNV